MAAEVPDSTFDAGRLAALAATGVLDTGREEVFDGIVELATYVCACPVALVSLVDRDRQWFKARVAFPHCETDLNSSVCAHALATPDQILEIGDLTVDPRTRDNPLVTGDPFIRFYAGAPLVTADGHVLGTLCVIDKTPRPQGLTTVQAHGLKALARQVLSQLDLRKAINDRLATECRQTALLEIGDQLRDLATVPDMTRAAATIVGRLLETDRAGFGHIEGDVEFVDIQPDWTAPGVASIAGRHRFDDFGDIRGHLQRGEPLVIDDVRTDHRTRHDPSSMLDIGIGALVNVPVRDRGRAVAVFIVQQRTARRWTPEELTFLRNVADRLEHGVARVRAQEHQALLNGELSHRMKNLMAMVQAVAIQTLKGVQDRDAVASFTDRVQALAAAHDVLLQGQWEAARIDAIIAGVLGNFQQLDRFDVNGPILRIGPRSALSMAMLLHELATNAVKYGALSADRGRVTLSWRVEQTHPEAELVLDWIERDGPPALEPTRKGFGSRLIRLGLVGTGGVALRYDVLGFSAEMRAPIAHVQQA